MRESWIVMPVLDCLALTRIALDTCFKQDIGPVKVLVVDAGSRDGTGEYLRSLHPRVEVLPLSRTAGVSRAWNVALTYLFEGGEPQVLVVNNDIKLRTDAYRLLVQDGGQFVTCVGTSTAGAQFPGDTPKMTRRPHPDFSCYLIRKECWQKVGKFDEDMVIYSSDQDYHLRMHLAGIDAFCLDVPFFHYASGTLKSMEPREQKRIMAQAELDRAAFTHKWGFAGGSPEYYAKFGHSAPEAQHEDACDTSDKAT